MMSPDMPATKAASLAWATNCSASNSRAPGAVSFALHPAKADKRENRAQHDQAENDEPRDHRRQANILVLRDIQNLKQSGDDHRAYAGGDGDPARHRAVRDPAEAGLVRVETHTHPEPPLPGAPRATSLRLARTRRTRTNGKGSALTHRFRDPSPCPEAGVKRPARRRSDRSGGVEAEQVPGLLHVRRQRRVTSRCPSRADAAGRCAAPEGAGDSGCRRAAPSSRCRNISDRRRSDGRSRRMRRATGACVR